MYKRCVIDLDDLKHRVKTERTKLDYAVMQLLCISGDVISECPSRLAAVISSIVFDVDIVFAAVTATAFAVVDQSNSCTLICRFGSVAVVSYDFVLCSRPTWRLFNSAR